MKNKTAFIAILLVRKIEKGLLTNDGVHLNDAGNQLVAEQMLKIIIK